MYQAATIEVPVGAIDGINRDFYTSQLYMSGSVIVFLNGMARLKDDDDGWIEQGGNRVQLRTAPLLEDTLQIYYQPQP